MKYSKGQLQKMAKVVLEAKSTHPVEYMLFVTQMMVRTGMRHNYIEDMIDRMANEQ